MWAGPGTAGSTPRTFQLDGAIPLSKLPGSEAAFVFKLEPGLLAALQAYTNAIRPCDPSAGASHSADADAAADAADGPTWSMLGGTTVVAEAAAEPNPDEPNPDEPNPDEPNPDEPDQQLLPAAPPGAHGDNGAHLLNDSNPKSATLTISPGMAAPYVYVDVSHGARPGGTSPISQLHSVIAAAVRDRMYILGLGLILSVAPRLPVSPSPRLPHNAASCRHAHDVWRALLRVHVWCLHVHDVCRALSVSVFFCL